MREFSIWFCFFFKIKNLVRGFSDKLVTSSVLLLLRKKRFINVLVRESVSLLLPSGKWNGVLLFLHSYTAVQPYMVHSLVPPYHRHKHDGINWLGHTTQTRLAVACTKTYVDWPKFPEHNTTPCRGSPMSYRSMYPAHLAPHPWYSAHIGRHIPHNRSRWNDTMLQRVDKPCMYGRHKISRLGSLCWHYTLRFLPRPLRGNAMGTY